MTAIAMHDGGVGSGDDDDTCNAHGTVTPQHNTMEIRLCVKTEKEMAFSTK